jgi:integrase/recombinase XerD
LTFYRNELKIFIQWAGEVGAKSLEEITADVLRSYFLNLRNRRNKNGIHKNYSVIKTWLTWAWIEYDLETACPITKVKVASPEDKDQPAIELDVFSKLLDTCRGRNKKRDYALLLLLIDTGIRRQEVCRLKISNLRKEGAIQLESDDTKTGEPGKAFMVLETQKALRSYLRERGDLADDAPLFATETGEPFTPSGLRQVIRRACKRAGISEQGLHSFRRGFALESQRAGADLVSISKLLRHKKTETTRRYLPQTDDDLRRVHDRTSPVNKLKKRK